MEPANCPLHPYCCGTCNECHSLSANMRSLHVTFASENAEQSSIDARKHVGRRRRQSWVKTHLGLRSLQPNGLVLVALCLPIAVPHRVVPVSVVIKRHHAFNVSLLQNRCIYSRIMCTFNCSGHTTPGWQTNVCTCWFLAHRRLTSLEGKGDPFCQHLCEVPASIHEKAAHIGPAATNSPYFQHLELSQ
jgi:hypothetical protein